jgi:hypothetical protein
MWLIKVRYGLCTSPHLSYHRAQLRYRLFVADISGFLEDPE